MTKRNPNPDPEIYELITTRKPESLSETIVLSQAPASQSGPAQEIMPASGAEAPITSGPSAAK